jgi:hypothetical protein
MRATIRRYRRFVSLPLVAIALLLGSAIAHAGGAMVTTEAGAYFDFLAPDPGAPSDGTIRFGFGGVVETIAADAELVPPADTNLTFLGGGTPTCLDVTREGDAITRLAFVAECTVSGIVTRVDDVFGAGADGYLIGDRLAAPAELVEGDPTFATLIGVPAATGGPLDVVFHVDVTTGVPTSFAGETSVTGRVGELGGGDVSVGAAVLPNAVIDDVSRALLEEAAALAVDATVMIAGLGTIEQKGQPGLEIELTVTHSGVPISPAPSVGALPDTAMRDEGSTGQVPASMLMLLALAGAGLALARWHLRSTP